MTGIDTNVLVRCLVTDNKDQTEQARHLLEAARATAEPIYVSCVVLCETAWVLRTAFGKPKTAILDAFEEILETDVFQLEEEHAVRKALDLSRKGPGDFADYLIGQLNRDRGCRVTVTFDRALRSDPAFSVL